jgi:hypothetical protein
MHIAEKIGDHAPLATHQTAAARAFQFGEQLFGQVTPDQLVWDRRG